MKFKHAIMQFKYAIKQLCYLVHYGPLVSYIIYWIKTKRRRDFLNLITLMEQAKFIGTGGGCDDEGGKTFPTKENEGEKTFSPKINERAPVVW